MYHFVQLEMEMDVGNIIIKPLKVMHLRELDFFHKVVIFLKICCLYKRLDDKYLVNGGQRTAKLLDFIASEMFFLDNSDFRKSFQLAG